MRTLHDAGLLIIYAHVSPQAPLAFTTLGDWTVTYDSAATAAPGNPQHAACDVTGICITQGQLDGTEAACTVLTPHAAAHAPVESVSQGHPHPPHQTNPNGQPTQLGPNPHQTGTTSVASATYGALPPDWAHLASQFGYHSFVAVPVFGGGPDLVAVLTAADKPAHHEPGVTEARKLKEPETAGLAAGDSRQVGFESSGAHPAAATAAGVADSHRRGRFSDMAWVSHIESLGLWLGPAALKDDWLLCTVAVMDALADAQVGVGLNAKTLRHTHTRPQV